MENAMTKNDVKTKKQRNIEDKRNAAKHQPV